MQEEGKPGWGPGTTHWSRLLDPAAREEPWRFFFDHYRGAVEALFRRSGVKPGDLDDMVQEFFTVALQRDFLARADPERGRFRGYLCSAARRFLASEWRKSGRLKRNPSEGVVALDSAIGASVSGGSTPDDEFDRAWARAVLARGVALSSQDYAAEGKPLHGRAFQLRQDGAHWDEVAEQLNTTPAAARGWVARFEARVAEHVRREVASTVASEAEVEAELRELSRILSEA